MATKRSKNVAQTKQKRSAASSHQKLQRRHIEAEPQVKEASQTSTSIIKNDITGVVFAVVAIAMIIAIVSNSQAPLTAAVSHGLKLSFGAGALLIPLAFLVYSATYFTSSDKVLGPRIAIGLSFIVLALLSFLALFVPGADVMPQVLFYSQNLISAGGYVGAGIAWLLLTFVGKGIGNVFLVGLLILGAIICGFSISELVAKIRTKLEAKKFQKKVNLAKAVSDGFLDEDGLDNDNPFSDDFAYAENNEAPVEPKTTFLGNRKTTILKRASSKVTGVMQEATGDLSTLGEDFSTPVEENNEVAATELLQEPKTTLLPKKKKSASKPADRTEFSQETQKLELADEKTNTSQEAPITVKRPGDAVESIVLPPLSMLKSNPHSDKSASSHEELIETGQKLQDTLAEFGLKSKVVGYASGPLVTTFKIEMGEGERVNKITNLQDDIQLSLASESVRIFAPIPGTSLVGIEIPNQTTQSVNLGDVLPHAKGGPLEFAVGRDSEGTPVIANLARMPHLLIAGTTGSGKSVMINSIIMSMLMRATPEQVRMILVDPKRVEFGGYNGLPHLYVPVVTEPRQASSALQWGVTEMERRLKVFERASARDIRTYNKMCVSGKLSELENPPTPMPYLVIVVDELSDLMMVAGKEVETNIVRIAQLGRAAGIHLIVATQRPSADVVTGLIKSNIDSRIALKVSSAIDSRVILDTVGADRLLGYGDMLFRYSGKQTRRILGCYTSDEEIESVVSFIREQGEPEYHNEILSVVAPAKSGASTGSSDTDPLFWDAAQLVVESQIGSTSSLQRRLSLGYARAARIMDMLEAKGVVGPSEGAKPREVLMTSELLEEFRQAEESVQGVE